MPLTPEFSRRLARVVNSPALAGRPEERRRLAEAATRAGSFRRLPAWARRLVIEGENSDNAAGRRAALARLREGRGGSRPGSA